MLKSAEEAPYEQEKDFVLFVDKEGKFSGDFEPPTEEPQSAINEETGEINWDCPCLQSALAPPCGEFFRDAFSCFVASQTEPKGSECLEKFAAMQDCFRANPEVYLKGAEEGEAHEDTMAQSSTVASELQTEEIINATEQPIETFQP
ncbi:hypothetical protein PSACC_01443 [Paramicrosporidium saccamoebae]|uniref:Mitochondrial intermembrane space import and assembly protein 40 n=1 Tax=Paramicrosporidium saccamoebae TaxID=1246581 RepID=A0A2H9TLR3_9FUNG|nr:hypothetical protein PSACC_01443 [Paramicrosporidium saccamoebae]